jgi:lipopolysaccharide/colanic/teichoic acid biosynthesis glycosyltransferase
MKRFFDVVVSTILLGLALPGMALVALAIRIGDGGPVFFFQRRVGRGGREFFIWKFRTMRQDAERLGPALTSAGDPRITRVGKLLRATKLDELPQLVNVLRGEMSLVGPRPEVPKYVAFYDESQRRALDVRPGITDPASLRFFDESELLAQADDPHRLYVEWIMPYKLRLNLAYIEQANVATDGVILLCTALRILRVRWSGRPFVRLPEEALSFADNRRRVA